MVFRADAGRRRAQPPLHRWRQRSGAAIGATATQATTAKHSSHSNAHTQTCLRTRARSSSTQSCAPADTYRHKPHATCSHSETTLASYQTPRYQDVHTQTRTTLHITRAPPPPPRPLRYTNNLPVARPANPLRHELTSASATPAPAGGTGAARRTVLSQRRHTTTYTATQAAAHTRTRKSMHAPSGQPVSLVLDTAGGEAVARHGGRRAQQTNANRRHRHVRRPNTRGV